MVIQTKVEINGVEFSDYQNARVSKTINSFNGVSNYKIRYDSPYGRHNDDFTVGDTIEIFSDENVIMPTVSPIAHYKMNDDEADTVVVDSAGSNNGTCSVNTDTINTTGKINGTLDSITDAKHETGDSFTMTPIVLDPSVGATVCFWHYTRSLASGWEAPNEYRDGKMHFLD